MSWRWGKGELFIQLSTNALRDRLLYVAVVGD